MFSEASVSGALWSCSTSIKAGSWCVLLMCSLLPFEFVAVLSG